MTDLLAIAHIIHRLANTELEAREDDIHMASPALTEQRGYGDCEDLALWRYERLLAEGVPPDNMQISAVNDFTHAVLDMCDSWMRCYRLDHNRPIHRIEKLPKYYINPQDGDFYERSE
jgi:predicted transglutaminase-like cysteine proteinase